ncbi:HNH endonuclease signature motif containing protein [Mycolicibacterium bacteremicum]|uniref:HNH endonuclease signature motif containing protein n=1 Tax=Mycolicibacterium bacteremicum TaxID=564198 RepID=UPI0026F29836|nr:HNH endonuclease signature motif containing protein [Mycolicibacterium bacteremicum]
MRRCQGCGAELTRRSQKVFCSNPCQIAFRRTTRTKVWLESGQGRAGSLQGHYIRSYIAAEQSGCCAICGGAGSWQGLPLTLVLDHIDGNSENNRRDNLRLVCPNCDSQLPTYKSRNRGNGRSFRRQRYADGKSY